jgi:phage host-nuclease inhibitor protein Gam
MHDKTYTDEENVIRKLKKQTEKGQKRRTECEADIKKEKAEIGKIQREVNSIEKKCEDKQESVIL